MTAIQATGSKKTTQEKKSAQEKKKDKFSPVYIRLRTALDSLEMMALQYCLKGENEKERIRRAKNIEEKLGPVFRGFKDATSAPPGDCPDGFYDCGGYCVPYPCPSEHKH